VALSSLRGRKVLLAFFPLAFTSVCTEELCAFSEDYGRFQAADTVVLPISVDSIPTLKEFKAKEKMTLDLLSDFRREVTRAYGTLIEDKFLSSRAYVLIDREGVVRWTFSEDTAGHRRENEELLAQLATVP
jgi:peroxiredoxin